MAAIDPNQNLPTQPIAPSPPPAPPEVTPQEVPPPPTEPAPTIPPFIGGQQVEPVAPPQAEAVPPTPASPAATTIQAQLPGSRNIKKVLTVIGILALLVVLTAAVASILLPRLKGGAGSPKGELTWWGLWEDEEIVKPLIEEYQQAHPGVTVTYVPQSKQDYRERLRNAIDSGSAPDIFRFHNTWVPMFTQDLDSLPSDVMSAQEFAQTFYPVASSDLVVSGSAVGIPLEYDGLGLFINEELFATYTKTPPKTWDELRQTALDLTIKDGNGVIQQAGAAMGITSNVDHWQEILALMMLQNGVNLVNPTDDLATNALEYYAAFNEEYGVWDETMPPSTTAFAAGKLAMYFGPSWRAFEIRDQNPNLAFRVVPVPQLPKDDPSEPDITYASYWAEGVWAEGDNTSTAWDFLSFLVQKDSLEKFYNNAARVRGFGEPYPRRDMRDLLLAHPILGGIVQFAPGAKSWYLAARTYDGETGINSRIGKYFEDAVNSVVGRIGGGSAEQALQTASAGVQQVLQSYGIATGAQAPVQ